jgi:alpha-glucuronidase
VFRFLSLIQTGRSIDRLNIEDSPKLQRRVLDHWDNLDGSVERGYAGRSIWDWPQLPETVDSRYVDYARACASVGINGATLNNVNAQAVSLTAPYIEKAKAIADVLRPYGIRVYLSARFSAPIEIGKLKTADPLDPAVRAWWKAKADEIYRAIPDFGGFVVKANSEGQPGPGDYHRSHAEGANALADAVAPHGGIVMWRAFVYASTPNTDRIKQAYEEFKPLDGKFASNVLVQVKSGPLDFQPLEPFHPLFGRMPKTNLMLEVQITKEYLGQTTHLTYVTKSFEEVLRADTFAKGRGSTVAKTLEACGLTGMAGVSNVGSDRNWCGSDFNQADWYGFGRLAWDPETSAREIAADWLKMTFSDAEGFVGPMVEVMEESREAVVRYMTPLGLHHQMATGHHYGPGPWVSDLGRADWNPTYFARADAEGIGFDRTVTGSNALEQYWPGAAAQWEDVRLIDPKYLLWFHRVPWSFKMKDGRTLWEALVAEYDAGVSDVVRMRKTWEQMAFFVDGERFEVVAKNLGIQEREAKWWRNAMLAYFQSKSGLAIPAGHPPLEHPLEYYESRQSP